MVVPFGVRMAGPLEPFASGFCAELARLGYTRLSARLQVGLVAHLSRWLAGEGLDAAALSPATVGAFLVARRAAGYTALRTPTALRPLLDHLRRIGVTPPSVESVAVSPVEVLLGRYRGFLIGERGLTSGTAGGYVDLVRPFLVGRVGSEGLDLDGLRAGDVTGFVLAECRRCRPRMAQRSASALRSLLHFLHVEGLLGASLVTAVPKVANRREGFQGPAPGLDQNRDHRGGHRRWAAGRSGPGDRAPAAPHRGHQFAGECRCRDYHGLPVRPWWMTFRPPHPSRCGGRVRSPRDHRPGRLTAALARRRRRWLVGEVHQAQDRRDALQRGGVLHSRRQALPGPDGGGVGAKLRSRSRHLRPRRRAEPAAHRRSWRGQPASRIVAQRRLVPNPEWRRCCARFAHPPSRLRPALVR